MKINEVRRLVSKIKVRLFKKANASTTGGLKSQFRGTGLQFKEHQVYAPGDDVRFIDWKLLAKTSNPYIKTFEEERNVEIVIILDASSSMFMGYDGVSKFQAGVEIVCAFFLLANMAKDKVQVMITGEETVTLPMATGERGVAIFLKYLEKLGFLSEDGQIIHQSPKAFQGDMSKQVVEALGHLRRKREVVIISDFMDLFTFEDIKKIGRNKSLHLYRVQSPLDTTPIWPFRILGLRSGGANFGRPWKKESTDKEAFAYKLIDLSSNYLDDFVRGLS